jgi:hypothetical protein
MPPVSRTRSGPPRWASAACGISGRAGARSGQRRVWRAGGDPGRQIAGAVLAAACGGGVGQAARCEFVAELGGDGALRGAARGAAAPRAAPGGCAAYAPLGGACWGGRGGRAQFCRVMAVVRARAAIAHLLLRAAARGCRRTAIRGSSITSWHLLLRACLWWQGRDEATCWFGSRVYRSWRLRHGLWLVSRRRRRRGAPYVVPAGGTISTGTSCRAF